MIVGVDVGASKTIVGRFSTTGELEESRRFPTPPDFGDFLSQLVETTRVVTRSTAPTKLGVATPGTIVDGTLTWGGGNFPWKNIAIHSLLEAAFPIARIHLNNDSITGALYETSVLPKPVERSLYITLSTGVGCGLIINQQPFRDFAVSEAGHMIIEYKGKLLEWEDVASGKTIAETYGAYAKDITSEKTWREIAERISRGLLILIPIIRPDVIIFGGSLGAHIEKCDDELKRHLNLHLPPAVSMPAIRKAKRPDEAVIYGSYLLATQ